MASYKHLKGVESTDKCFERLALLEQEPGNLKEFVDGLDVMLSIRNLVRVYLRNDERRMYDRMLTRCNILLNLNPNLEPCDTGTRKSQIVSFLKLDCTNDTMQERLCMQAQRMRFVCKGFDFANLKLSEIAENVPGLAKICLISLADVSCFEIIKWICHDQQLGLKRNVIESVSAFMKKNQLNKYDSFPRRLNKYDSFPRRRLGLLFFRLLRDCESEELDRLVFEMAMSELQSRASDDYILFGLCCQTIRSVSDASECLNKYLSLDLLKFSKCHWTILLGALHNKLAFPFLCEPLVKQRKEVPTSLQYLSDRALALQTHISTNMREDYRQLYLSMIIDIGKQYLIYERVQNDTILCNIRILQSILSLNECENRCILGDLLGEINVSSDNERIMGFVVLFSEVITEEHDVKIDDMHFLVVDGYTRTDYNGQQLRLFLESEGCQLQWKGERRKSNTGRKNRSKQEYQIQKLCVRTDAIPEAKIRSLIISLIDYAIQYPMFVSSACVLKLLSQLCLESLEFADLCRDRIGPGLLRNTIGAFRFLDTACEQMKTLQQLRVKSCSGWERVSFASDSVFVSPRLRQSGHGQITITRTGGNGSFSFELWVESPQRCGLRQLASKWFESSALTTTVRIRVSKGVLIGNIDTDPAQEIQFAVGPSCLYHIGIRVNSSEVNVTSDAVCLSDIWEGTAANWNGLFDLPLLNELYHIPKETFDATSSILNGAPVKPGFYSPFIKTDLEWNPVPSDDDDKFLSYFKAEEIGEQLHGAILDTLAKQISLGYLSLALIKLIHAGRYNLDPSAHVRLFVNLVLQFEKFSSNWTDDGIFPYSLSQCPWKDSGILRSTPSLQASVVQKVLSILVEQEDFVDNLCCYLQAAFRHPSSHFPKKYTKNLSNDTKDFYIFVPKFGVEASLPIFRQTLTDRSTFPPDGSFLVWSVTDSSCIFESPFEFLLLLKNFIHMARKPEHLEFVRSVFVDSLVIYSPFFVKCVDKFLQLLFQIEHVKWRSTNIEYYTRVKLLLDNEHLLPTSLPRWTKLYFTREFDWGKTYYRIVTVIGPYFPEFSGTKAEPPKENLSCNFSEWTAQARQIPKIVEIDEMRAILTHYENIEDFPWWIYFLHWMRIQRDTTTSLSFNVLDIRDQFIKDCRVFVFEWNMTHTKSILSCLTEASMWRDIVYKIHDRSPRSSTGLSEMVEKLAVMAIGRLNEHYCSYGGEYKPEMNRMIPRVMQFLTFSTTSKTVTSLMEPPPPRNELPPRIEVDRKGAYSSEACPTNFTPIITQVVAYTRSWSDEMFRCTPLPWKVHFKYEGAIDAGGPARELLTEIATSLFLPTSGLMRQAPSRSDMFIPSTLSRNEMQKKKDEYRFIGQYLGIIMRSGLCQELPFSALVWKYLANEPITEEDITSLDFGLRDKFAAMRQASLNPSDASRLNFQWNTTDWLGNSEACSGHKADEQVNEWEYEQYINVCVKHRIESIKHALSCMRVGLVSNIGELCLSICSSAMLQMLCQGEAEISVEEMQSCAVYSDFHPTETPVVIFWKVVEQMDNTKRSLLLRFITTLSRLPLKHNRANFQIIIQRRTAHDPDKEFIRASTCFNRLYLPCYTNFESAWDRINMSIEMAPTMENS